MRLEQTIMEELKGAMRAKDEGALRALRAVKAAILLAKTAEGGRGELTEDDEIRLLQKLVKQRRDSLEIFRQQQREDLARKEEEEIGVIERFLPKPVTEEELRVVLSGIIAETGAQTPADMGRVMGLANQRLAGRADGKTIAATVKELLPKG
ncbi:MAG: hypothetical protein RJA57_332 [Bacteroidota bacterium]|jgi:uncharacterized protein YqeY